MPRTYLFYDTETSGLNVAFDQVLRFAAIRTDESLNELERHQISIRLRPDIIPAPEALLTTGLSVPDLFDGDCEFEALATIHALFNTPNTITVGYNNLGFDDELLRFSFYRNFLPPYSHQHSNGCGRMDLLPMTVMVRLFRRHWLAWPEIDGKGTLRLEHLNRENTLARGRAHDAMVDVEATLELARRYSREPKEWSWLTGLFDKAEDRKRRDAFPELCAGEPGVHRLALIANSRIGSEDGYIAPVVSLGHSIPYRNQMLWLRLDKCDLSETTLENVGESTWAFRKRDGDELLLLNLRPKYIQMLRGERLARMNENRRLLETRPDLLAYITAYHRTYRYPVIPEIDADASLYGDFLNPVEEAACAKFRASAATSRPELIDAMPTPRLAALAMRALGRNYAGSLIGERATQYSNYMASVHPSSGVPLVDYKGKPRHTPADALKSILLHCAGNTISPKEREILDSLRSYVGEQFGLTEAI